MSYRLTGRRSSKGKAVTGLSELRIMSSCVPQTQELSYWVSNRKYWYRLKITDIFIRTQRHRKYITDKSLLIYLGVREDVWCCLPSRVTDAMFRVTEELEDPAVCRQTKQELPPRNALARPVVDGIGLQPNTNKPTYVVNDNTNYRLNNYLRTYLSSSSPVGHQATTMFLHRVLSFAAAWAAAKDRTFSWAIRLQNCCSLMTH